MLRSLDKRLLFGGAAAQAISTFAWLNGERVSVAVNCKKSGAFGKEKTFLTQLIKENAIPPATSVAGFLA